MNFLRRWRRRRELKRQIDDLWEPSFDTLAHYNGRKANGVEHIEAKHRAMAPVQQRYDEVYLPRCRALSNELRAL